MVLARHIDHFSSSTGCMLKLQLGASFSYSSRSFAVRGQAYLKYIHGVYSLMMSKEGVEAGLYVKTRHLMCLTDYYQVFMSPVPAILIT